MKMTRQGIGIVGSFSMVAVVGAVFGIASISMGMSITPAEAVEGGLKTSYHRPTEIPFPDPDEMENNYTTDREKLGQTLFFDPRLSGSNWISCATCHNPAFAWGDGLPKGIGHGMIAVGRKTPTVLNLAWSPVMFWDGRMETLEEQALGPITAPGEMNQNMDDLMVELKNIAGYPPLFEMAYPGEGISPQTVGKAIATFERMIVSGTAPFDQWIAGEEDAISESAKRGFMVFNTKARCAACHSEWQFTDFSFHDIGLPSDDIGRGAVLPKVKSMKHAFKTPTLRNVDQRGPYMHDGSLGTLQDVVNHYVAGGVSRPSRSDEIKPLALTGSDIQDLIAFLHTLTSDDPPMTVPTLPH